ncbi:PIN domain-containing protein [bacterium]|nr:PIN domain-containing protein [bacterium]
MKIPVGLNGQKGVVIDTNVFIYLFEDSPQYGEVAEFIISQAERNVFQAVVTPITVAEIIIKPIAMNRLELADRCRSALRRFMNIVPTDIPYQAGELAGALKAKYGLPLPDMMQAAMAMQTDSAALITNDKALSRIEELDVYLLHMFL